MSLWNWACDASFVHPSHDTRVNMEERWKCIDGGKLKDWEKTLFEFHFVRHKS
jgi:hypothetical protein